MKVSTKIGILILSGLLFTAFTSAAETRYVSEDLTITLRTGPGNDRKIIAFPKSGDALEVVTAGDEYTEVRMPNGKQGWVLTRYLTKQVPAHLVLQGLQRKHARLVEKYDALRQQSSELSTESKGLAGNLNETQKALEKLTAEHETLKSESKEFLELKAKYETAVKDAAAARDRADKLDKELQQLYSSEMNTGLLYGGGLIVLGFVVGFILKKPKRRSQLM